VEFDKEVEVNPSDELKYDCMWSYGTAITLEEISKTFKDEETVLKAVKAAFNRHSIPKRAEIMNKIVNRIGMTAQELLDNDFDGAFKRLENAKPETGTRIVKQSAMSAECMIVQMMGLDNSYGKLI
jgi:protein-disulfide isomerase-like protein with CxxC motif